MHKDSTLHQIALTLVPGVGPVKAKNLIAFCGSAEAVFSESRNALLKIPEIGKHAVEAIRDPHVLELARSELSFIEDHGVSAIFFTDKEYPERLKLCDDGPVMLYLKGRVNLNQLRIISIVGTRKATSYGKRFCDALIQALVPWEPLIVSGLAYGIDIAAHRAALTHGLPTIACLAHGLDKIYPPLHSPVAREMQASGGLLTEFPSGTRPDRELFPMRNRIIAGIADCTLVIETDERGGSMITAHLANSYGRDVYALPGRHDDTHSRGCNLLIRKNIAGILTSPSDIIDLMGWESGMARMPRQTTLFEQPVGAAGDLWSLLADKGRLGLDDLAYITGKPISSVSALLLELEFSGHVKSLPGKVFEAI